MASRRDLLAVLGAGTLGGLAGCSSLVAAEGYVQLKVVVGERSRAGTLQQETVIDANLGENETQYEIDAEVADRWADRVRDPERLTVSAVLHDDLRSYYDEIRYVVGVCSPEWTAGANSSAGCHNADADREDFNQVQVYDRVRASYSEGEIKIHGVEGTWTFTTDDR